MLMLYHCRMWTQQPDFKSWTRLVVWISEKKLDYFYHSGFSDNCLHLNYIYSQRFGRCVPRPSFIYMHIYILYIYIYIYTYINTYIYIKYMHMYIYYIYIYIYIGLMSRVFANGLGDRGSILDRVIPKTQKMVLDAALLNTHNYKVRIKGKCGAIQGRSSTLPDNLVK